MKNTFSYMTNTAIHNVEFNRKNALHNCALRHPILWREWSAFKKQFSNYDDWSSTENACYLDSFIEQKRIKIVSEKTCFES